MRVDRGRGEHRAPAYLAMNPQGLIPVLEHGDLVLFETGAILWHLAERQGRLGPDGPPADDPAARAAVLKWLFYLSNTVHAEMRVGFYAGRYVDAPDTPDAASPLLRGLARRLHGHLDLLEAQLGGGWLAGAGPTVADLYLGVLLRWAQLYPGGATPLRSLDGWPALHALCRRIEDRPAAARSFAAEAIPSARGITAPERPALPAAEVTG